MSTSFLLDTNTWDLCLDINGNWAVCTDPYSVAQDVACAVRTFIGECYYDTTIGIPYFQQVLGQTPPLSLLKTLICNQAATVPGCNNPVLFITSFANRAITGQVQFTDSNGVIQIVPFSQAVQG